MIGEKKQVLETFVGTPLSLFADEAFLRPDGLNLLEQQQDPGENPVHIRRTGKLHRFRIVAIGDNDGTRIFILQCCDCVRDLVDLLLVTGTVTFPGRSHMEVRST